MAHSHQSVEQHRVSIENVVDSFSVRQRELAEIVLRRSEQTRRDKLTCGEQHSDRESNPGEPRSNLIGLALSGGGIRSGTLGLGVLQALHARCVLPYVDYLSTVSGGGYAGAYLSSVAVEGKRPSNHGNAYQAGAASTGQKDAGDLLFPIAPRPDGSQSIRMRDFIRGGKYLRKTWMFFNRYLIGLLLVWLIVISALVAGTALAAWTFRLLDGLRTREFIAALGFDDDVKLAFFPSFVLFVLWFFTWIISYFKYGHHATGTIARLFFYALIIMTLIAFAALIGTGDIAIPGLSGGGTATTIPVGVQIALFSLIAGALLPYFNLNRLLMSGTSPQNSFEKYTFWISTRALVYGVPFVLVAIFAQENISGWNEQRDSRLVLNEVGSWSASAPIWRELALDQKRDPASSPKVTVTGENGPANAQILPPAIGSLWPKCAENKSTPLENLHSLSTADLQHQIEKTKKQIEKTKQQWENGPKAKAANKAQDVKQLLEAEAVPGELALEFEEACYLFELQRRLTLRQTELEVGHLTKKDLAEFDEKNTVATERMGQMERWWHLFDYLGETTYHLSLPQDHAFHQNWLARKELREARERIVELVNRRLADRNLYQCFMPTKIMEDMEDKKDNKDNEGDLFKETYHLVQPRLPNSDPQGNRDRQYQLWWDHLKTARHRAATVAEAYQSEVSGTGPKQREVLEDRQTRAVLAANRQLLRALYGNLIGDQAIVYSYTVLKEDQRTRMRWFLWSFALFLLAGLLVDLNATSLHGFYSAQIGKTWIEPTDKPVEKKITLDALDTTGVGRPYHLILGSVQLLGRREQVDENARDQFLFSREYCGADCLGYVATREYMGGEYALVDAIAVSGAAVTPAQTDNPLIVALMTLGNIRLGQWLDNPAFQRHGPEWYRALCRNWFVTPLRLILNVFRPAERRPSCFVSDGGHYENLGIEPLLKRRCKLIIAADAGQDGNYQFADLMRLVRRMDAEHGITFECIDGETSSLDLEPLIPPACHIQRLAKVYAIKGCQTAGLVDEAKQWSKKNHLVIRIRYPKTADEEASSGTLIYLKCSMTGRESAMLKQFKRANPTFPHDPTSDQFYDATRFNSYRELGYYIADQACQKLGDDFAASYWDVGFDDFIQRLTGTPPDQ